MLNLICLPRSSLKLNLTYFLSSSALIIILLISFTIHLLHYDIHATTEAICICSRLLEIVCSLPCQRTVFPYQTKSLVETDGVVQNLLANLSIHLRFPCNRLPSLHFVEWNFSLSCSGYECFHLYVVHFFINRIFQPCLFFFSGDYPFENSVSELFMTVYNMCTRDRNLCGVDRVGMNCGVICTDTPCTFDSCILITKWSCKVEV